MDGQGWGSKKVALPHCDRKSEVRVGEKAGFHGVTSMVVLPVALHPSQAAGQRPGGPRGPAGARQGACSSETAGRLQALVGILLGAAGKPHLFLTPAQRKVLERMLRAAYTTVSSRTGLG